MSDHKSHERPIHTCMDETCRQLHPTLPLVHIHSAMRIRTTVSAVATAPSAAMAAPPVTMAAPMARIPTRMSSHQEVLAEHLAAGGGDWEEGGEAAVNRSGHLCLQVLPKEKLLSSIQ